MTKRDDLKSLLPKDSIDLNNEVADSREIINNLSKTVGVMLQDNLLFEDSPLDETSNWDDLELGSIYMIKNLGGQNAPSPDKDKFNATTGLVLSIGTDRESDYQIAISAGSMAIRTIGQDWSYVGKSNDFDGSDFASKQALQNVQDSLTALQSSLPNSYATKADLSNVKGFAKSPTQVLNNGADILSLPNGFWHSEGVKVINSPFADEQNYTWGYFIVNNRGVFAMDSSNISYIYGKSTRVWKKIQTDDNYTKLQNLINDVRDFAKYPVQELNEGTDIFSLPEGSYTSWGKNVKNSPLNTELQPFWGTFHVSVHIITAKQNKGRVFVYSRDPDNRRWLELADKSYVDQQIQTAVDKAVSQALAQANAYTDDMTKWRESDDPEGDAQKDPANHTYVYGYHVGTQHEYNTVYVRYAYKGSVLPEKRAVVNSAIYNETVAHTNITQDDLDADNYKFGKELRQTMMNAPSGYSTSMYSSSSYVSTPDGYKPSGVLFTKYINNNSNDPTTWLAGNNQPIPYNSEIWVNVNKN